MGPEKHQPYSSSTNHKVCRSASSRKEHRIHNDLLAACKVGESFGVFPNRIGPHHRTSQRAIELHGAPGPALAGIDVWSMSPDGVDSSDIADSVFSRRSRARLASSQRWTSPSTP
ncbi:hypothetical protein PR002_g21549 [Phytophthora rubi]|uniref:Uncharacterized protein n=1 Tax=Phytophthora rubi TaxID=129364 RepID=A0A6A3JA86_9STRA|nr:hypothetical protein PR002_g21549 [Phytophthora rubi]